MKLTKKNVFWGSLTFFLIFVALFVYRDQLYDYCFRGSSCWKFWDALDIIAPFLFFSIPIFLFSLITYKLRDEVFLSWIGFVKWWIPLSIVLTLITPTANGGYFVSLWDSQMTALVTSLIFIIASLTKIIETSVRVYRK